MSWRDAPIVEEAQPAWMSAPEVGAAKPQAKKQKEGLIAEQVREVTTEPVGSIPGQVLHGAASLPIGATQLAANLVGMIPGLGGVADSYNQQVSEKFVKPYEQSRQRIAGRRMQQEQGPELEQIRRVDPALADYLVNRHQPGFSGPELAGSAVTGGAIASKIPVVANTARGMLPFLQRTATGAGVGAGFGAANPVDTSTSPDFWTQKAAQTATGGAMGAVLPPVGSATARVVRPDTSQNVRRLMDEGITPTPGQILGGGVRALEEKASSIPLLGAAIRSGEDRATGQLNRAAINRALRPVGEDLPDGVAGREAIGYVQDRLGQRYEDVLNRIGAVQIDNPLQGTLQRTRMQLQNLRPETAEQFGAIIDNELLNRAANGALDGQAIKAAESNLRSVADGYRRSQDYDQRQLAFALDEARQAMRGWLVRQSPQNAAELQAINTGYANFKRVQRAASSVGAEEGEFSAAQLHNAVKASDRSKDKGQFARGEALMQDLSEPAKGVLSRRVPNSGTADRSLLALMVGAPLSGAAINPAIALGALPALAYTNPGQRTLAALLAQRPQSAGRIADLLRQHSQTTLPAAAGGAQQE